MYKTLRTFAVGAVLALAPLAGQAQDYPNQPITFVVPFPAGSTGEVIGRQIADRLTKRLGQPVLIQPVPGGAGVIGSQQVANSTPDGYTLLFHSSSIVLNDVLKPGQLDITKDLAPVTPAAFGYMGVFVNPSVPADDLKGFIAYAKAHPGELNYGSSGTGSQTHLYSALFNSQAGIDLAHIPYEGGSPSVIGAVSNEVQELVIAYGAAKPQADSGKLKLLAIASHERLADLPDVPTVDEAGLPGYFADFWFGFFAPAGTPDAILDKLNTEINAVIADPTFVQALKDQGYEARGMSRSDFASLLVADKTKWQAAVKAANVPIQ
jgi:tripartite-type tricarboxylate transporter receptor subunit TctC